MFCLCFECPSRASVHVSILSGQIRHAYTHRLDIVHAAHCTKVVINIVHAAHCNKVVIIALHTVLVYVDLKFLTLFNIESYCSTEGLMWVGLVMLV